MDPLKINFLKRLLLHSFLIGCGFYVFSLAIIFAFQHKWIALAQTIFHLNESAWWMAILIFLIGAKLIMVFFMLVPALALHWCGKNKEYN